MSATRKSIQPELSPRGAEMRRSEIPLKRRPAGTPVPRSRRSARPWGEASRRGPAPAPPAGASRSFPASSTCTRSCHGGSPSRGSRSRTAKSGRRVSPYSGRGTSNSDGIGDSSVPAYPWGANPQPSTAAANSRKSARQGSGPRSGSSSRSRMQPRSCLCPSTSCRFRIAPALASAGAETTRPSGWMNPSHSR